MKADYVHKDSKTINDEIVSYKITMPLINVEELQRIDNHYNELVDEFTKQFVKEKDMIIAQRIMMNLRKENKLLLKENQKLKSILELYKASLHREHEAIHRANDLEDENQKLKEKINKIQTIVNYEYDFYDSTEDLIEDIRKILDILSEVE